MSLDLYLNKPGQAAQRNHKHARVERLLTLRHTAGIQTLSAFLSACQPLTLELLCFQRGAHDYHLEIWALLQHLHRAKQRASD